VRIVMCAVVIILAILLCGCHEPFETESNHFVHAGELATLVCGSRMLIPVATERDHIHALADAVYTGDENKLDHIVSGGHAITLPEGTHVTVQRESFNERLVRVEEGEWAGSRVWVPLEWLKPVVAPPLPHGRR
jgi:hypothetical protein